MLPVNALITQSLSRMTPTVTEITLQCSDGIKLAGQSWTTSTNNYDALIPQQKRRILCLHGWMDNCRSFYHFAPALLQQLSTHTTENIEVELIALDLPGHGWSSHKSADGPPALLAESAFYVAEAVEQLQWNTATNVDETAATNANATTLLPFALIGHSMGAAVSCLYAAAFPEQVQKLILLEGGGPMARNPRDFAKHVRQHVQRRQLGTTKSPRIYPSLQKAVETRCQSARNFPGNQYLSETAATEMVVRGTRPVLTTTTTTTTEDAGGAGLQFRHDPRLQWPSVQYFTDEQVEALYEDVQCPTQLLLSVDGWPFCKDRHQRALDILKPVVHKTLPGSHHFHADPDTADQVVDEVAAFLLSQ